MEESYDELRDVDWIQIPNFPFIMKSKFDENGYDLIISDLKKVYVEKLDEKAVQERFQILNPHAEMRSKVILKHVKESLESILANNPTDCNMDFTEDKISFHLTFNVIGLDFMFDLLLHSMTDDKIRDYIIAPTLLLALILNEENLALKRKIEELEKKELTIPMSRSNDKLKLKDIYAGLSKKSNIAAKDTIEAFLYLQKNKITCLPESLKDTPKKLPKEIHLSSVALDRKLVYAEGISKNEISLPDSQKSQESIVPQKRELKSDDLASASNENIKKNNAIKVEATLKAEHHQRKKKKLLNL